MDYFTEAWHGDTSEKADEVLGAYRQHLAGIVPRLPPSVRELASETNLHDGRIRRVVLDGDTLLMELRCGDLQDGYFDLDLSYEQAVLSGSDVEALRGLAGAKNAEALYDEVDVEAPGAFVHRILFWLWRDGGSYQEVTIRFQGLALTKTPQPGRGFVRLESRLPRGGAGAV